MPRLTMLFRRLSEYQKGRLARLWNDVRGTWLGGRGMGAAGEGEEEEEEASWTEMKRLQLV